MVFVASEDWDEAVDGKFDQDNVVEEMLFDKLTKGIWTLKGQKGHYEFTEFDEGVMVEKTREHTGESPFAKEGLAAKKKLILEGQQEVSKSRTSSAVEAPKAMGMNDIMAFLKSSRSISGSTGTGESGDGDGAVSVHSQSSCENDNMDSDTSEKGDEDGLSDPRARLRGFFAGSKKNAASSSAKSKSVGKAKSVAKPSAGSTAARASGGGGSSKTASTSPTPKRPKRSVADSGLHGSAVSAGKPAGPGREVVRLDGRASRLQASLQEGLKNCADELQKVRFDDVTGGIVLTKQERAEMDARLASTGKALAKMEGQVKWHVARIHNSPNRTSLEDEVVEFESLLTRAQACSAFVSQVRMPTPQPDEILAALQTVLRLGYKLSLPFLVAEIHAKTTQAMMFHDFESLVLPFEKSSPEVGVMIEQV